MLWEEPKYSDYFQHIFSWHLQEPPQMLPLSSYPFLWPIQAPSHQQYKWLMYSFQQYGHRTSLKMHGMDDKRNYIYIDQCNLFSLTSVSYTHLRAHETDS